MLWEYDSLKVYANLKILSVQYGHGMGYIKATYSRFNRSSLSFYKNVEEQVGWSAEIQFSFQRIKLLLKYSMGILYLVLTDSHRDFWSNLWLVICKPNVLCSWKKIFAKYLLQNYLAIAKVYLESSRISTDRVFCEAVNSFCKNSLLPDVQLGSQYTSLSHISIYWRV